MVEVPLYYFSGKIKYCDKNATSDSKKIWNNDNADENILYAYRTI